MSSPYFSSPHTVVLKQQWPFTYTNLKKNPPSMAQAPSSRCLSLSNVSLAVLAEPLSHAKWLLVKMGLEGEQKQNEPSMARLPPFFTGKWHAQLKSPPSSHCLVAHFICLSSSVSGWLWQAPALCKVSHDPWTLAALQAKGSCSETGPYLGDKRGQQGIFRYWLSMLVDTRNCTPQEEMTFFYFIIVLFCFVLFYFYSSRQSVG